MRTKKIIGLIDQQMMLHEYWESLVNTHNIADNREHRNVMYRHAFFTAARHFSNLSLSVIGKVVGRDHATVLHACKMHKNNYTFDKIYRTTFDTMAHSISELIEEHTDNLEKVMSAKLNDMNSQVYENSLVTMYKHKLEKTEKVYEERISAIKHDLKIAVKQLRHFQNRAEKLNKECLRLKNLL